MISDKVYKLCTSKESVSALLAQDPTMTPGDAWKKLYGGHLPGEKESKSTAKAHRDKHTPEDLQRALACGNWGPTEPSELFLRMYHDALCTLDNSVSGCMVSPSLMGSCGTIPLTVISVVPDIMRHMSNLIVRAEKEVILATNYWQNSVASKYITNAMRELSRRAGARGEKIIFKMEYDRGSPKQFLDNHYSVSEKEYVGKAVNIPPPSEIPNIDLQVVNYHRPLLGTFHCKYMVVDRKYAVLQSNNIQDNDNLEMMTHLEGPIVDSLYDMALISWHKKLEPPLPSHNSPAVQGGLGSFGRAEAGHNDSVVQGGPGTVGNADGLAGNYTDGAHQGHAHPERGPQPANGTVRPPTSELYTQHSSPGDPSVISSQQSGAQSTNTSAHNGINQPGVVPAAGNFDSTSHGNDSSVITGPSTTQSVARPIGDSPAPGHGVGESMQQLNLNNQSENSETGFEHKDLQKHEVMRENATAAATTGAYGINHGNTSQTTSNTGGATDSSHAHGTNGPDAKAKLYFGSGESVIPQSQVENPSPAGNLLPEHTTDEPHYDDDIAGEVARVQTSVSPKREETRVQAVTRHLNHTKNEGFNGNAPECATGEEMTPYIPHHVSQPFPIAMVCREPYGTPNHNSVYNPQNEVWLSALRNAEKNVFIQSPTLNAEPLVPAIIEACERGVDVFCYICLGYNDTGELLPNQGGTNEMIAHKIATTLSAEAKQNFHYFFYIGKDMTVPLVAKHKKRSCHIKVMIVDEHIGIQGNGNQDTQSWYHSQEINVMFDNGPVCKQWIDGLRRNQNTEIYGQVSKEDGVWRDENGNEAEDVIGIDPGRFSWTKGFVGAIQRVRGAGDF